MKILLLITFTSHKTEYFVWSFFYIIYSMYMYVKPMMQQLQYTRIRRNVIWYTTVRRCFRPLTKKIVHQFSWNYLIGKLFISRDESSHFIFIHFIFELTFPSNEILLKKKQIFLFQDSYPKNFKRCLIFWFTTFAYLICYDTIYFYSVISGFSLIFFYL